MRIQAAVAEACWLAVVIGTIFFISGIVTLLQTIVGDRLPIIQVHFKLVALLLLRIRHDGALLWVGGPCQ